MAENDEELTFVPEPEVKKGDIVNKNEELDSDIEQLEEIQTDLQELKHLTGSSSAWFVRGILQGAGAIIGSILMVIVLGWVLSILGVIPGVAEIADYIRGYLNQVQR